MEDVVTLAVSLHDFDGLPDTVRADAESRFAKALHREFGSMDAVADACKAFTLATESTPEEMTEDDVQWAKRWTRAFEKARSAGFRDLGEAPEAYFEARLV